MNPHHPVPVRIASAASLPQQHPIAALYHEGVVEGTGSQDYPSGFLAGCYQLVRAAGGLCIFNEAQLGLGRNGAHWWHFESHGVVPDIAIVSEAVANGFPLAAIITRPEIASRCAGLIAQVGDATALNSLASAVGLSVLGLLQAGMLEQVTAVSNLLKLKFELLQKQHECIGAISGVGLLLSLDIVEAMDPDKPSRRLAEAIKETLHAHKLLVTLEGPQGNILTFSPSYLLSAPDVELLYSALHLALSHLTVQPESLRFAAPPDGREEFFRELLARWDIPGGAVRSVTPLESYEDANFRVAVGEQPPGGGDELEGEELVYVLKIDNMHTRYAQIDLQHHAMQKTHSRGIQCSTHVPLATPDRSRFCCELPSGHYCRLLNYLPGTVVTRAVPFSMELLSRIGSMCGKVVAALAGLPAHPADKKYCKWNMLHCVQTISTFAPAVHAPEQHRLLMELLAHYSASFYPAGLRCQIIHGDFNDANLLLMPSMELGLIDFGDIGQSYLVAELAIACAYAVLVHDTADYCTVILPIIQAFHRQCPLTKEEFLAIWPLIVFRLMLTVVLSASALATQDLSPLHAAYVGKSAPAAWKFLATHGIGEDANRIRNAIRNCVDEASFYRF